MQLYAFQMANAYVCTLRLEAKPISVNLLKQSRIVGTCARASLWLGLSTDKVLTRTAHRIRAFGSVFLQSGV